MIIQNDNPVRTERVRTIVQSMVSDALDPNNFQLVKKTLQASAPTTRTSAQGNQTAVQDYDLKLIDRFSDSEPLAFQAFAKIAEKALNGGYTFASKDQDALNYVKQRLRDFSLVSNLPTRIWIEQIVNDLIKYSNAFIYKYRDPEMSNGSPINIDGKPTDPIACLIRLDATSVTPVVDDKGNIKSYEIGSTDTSGGGGGGKKKKVPPEDMFHLFAYKNARNNLGTPFLWPVMDDIRVLRKMEENVEMLVHKHLFPLYHYIVGTEDYPAEPEEIEKVHYDLERIPTEGSLVTPERHKIEVVGAQGVAINAERYLAYFQNRVLIGFGIGSVSFGAEGEGASRSTAETIDRSLIERAKYFQNIFKAFMEEQVISELLKEGGYEQYDVQNEVDVFVNFNEIDIDTQIKKENHYANMYNNQGYTYDEYRMGIGKDNILEGDEQEGRLQFNMFGHKEIAESKSGVEAEIKSKDQPANQYGEKSSPKRTRDARVEDQLVKEFPASVNMEGQVKSIYEAARTDVISAIKSSASTNDAKDRATLILGMTQSAITSVLNSFIDETINSGYKTIVTGKIADSLVAKDSNRQFGYFVDKTITNVKNNVINILDNANIADADKTQRVSATFDLYNSYLSDASQTIAAKAFNYGKALALKDNGSSEALITPNENACLSCKEKSGTIDLSILTFDSVPPHHKKCNCEVSQKVDKSNE